MELAPQSETIVLVTVNSTGNLLLEMNPRVYDRHQVTLATGVVTVKNPLRPIPVKLANFSPYTRKLPKNCIVGDIIPAPHTVHEVIFGPNGPEVKEVQLPSLSGDSSESSAGPTKSLAPLTKVNYDDRSPIYALDEFNAEQYPPHAEEKPYMLTKLTLTICRMLNR